MTGDHQRQEGMSRELGTLRKLHELMCRVNAGEDLPTVLQSLVDGVADVAGFRIAAVSILHPNQEFEMLAVAGDDDARAALVGKRTPLADIAKEFDLAENWGVLRFVPHERLDGSPQGWIPDVAPLDVPDAWHPEDLLLAPLHAPTGEMVGLLSVDLPVDGLRPDQFARDALDMYAVQAGIAISNAKQREQAREEIRLAGVVHGAARAVHSALDPAGVLAAAVDPIREGLHCDAVWVRVLGEPDGAGGDLRAVAEPVVTDSPGELVNLATEVARKAWKERRAVILAGARPLWESPDVGGSNPLFRPPVAVAQQASAVDWLDRAGCHSVMLVPIGAGPDCSGYVLLGQATATATWQASEVEAALEIGREIGRALLRAKVYEELRELDRYKSETFSTVAHELKNPLAALTGHVEMLQGDGLVTSEAAAPSLAAIDRAAGRLNALVEDLLVLARVSDRRRPLTDEAVDLGAVVRDAADLLEPQAARHGVTLELAGVDGVAVVQGDPVELDRVVTNLLSNAVKFSPEGGPVTMELEDTGAAVVLRCSDKGIGISEDDQQQLFTEFFRSTAPAALQVPGTGLGLAIVKRIVDRHGGSIEVDSMPGRGTTFVVTLPAGPPDARSSV